MQEFKYLISLIMPVYNSSAYLEEAIESIINQSIGLDKLQLIAVNDGSTDNSGEIIKRYQALYPESILYIEKENGGVASARNEGLKYVLGKYVSFPDPDDTLSKNAYKDACRFFDKHYNETNVVSFPIFFFGDMQGEHPLNSKFNRENRVIDLLSEGEFQLHITSSLIKSEVAKKIHFDSELVASEDAKALLRILIDTPRLGTVNTARYNYRKHSGTLISTAASKKEWYSDHITRYFDEILDCAEQKYEKIPTFIQNAVAYDLGWKLSAQKAYLDGNETEEFLKRFLSCLSRLDDSAILGAKSLSDFEARFLLAKKYGDNFEITQDDIVLQNGMSVASEYPFRLEFIDTCADKFIISCRALTPFYHKISSATAYVNGRAVRSRECKYETHKKFLGKELSIYNIFDFEIEKELVVEKMTVYFSVEINGVSTVSQNIIFGKFFPLERKYSSSFFEIDDYAVSYDENALIFEKSTPKKLKRLEGVFKKELWKSNGFAERKAVIARTLASIYRRLHKKPLWIISDRLSNAGDNGEALFEHLNKTKFKDASFFFAIRRGEDYSRLKKQGRVVNRASLKYKILFLASDIIISSHAEDFVINPFDYYSQPYKDILCEKKFVFLQHGVTKDDLSSWLNRYNKNIKGFVTSSKAEYDSILNSPRYHYTENEVWLTGMPRFDALFNNSMKFITVLPTWRRYLASNIDIATGDWEKSEGVKNSEYVSFWNSFLNDERLTKALKRYGYRILLVPHPNMKEIIDFIDTPWHVSVITSPNYRQLYEISALMITDYSSAVFDFAYLEKPVVYAQFDKDEFFSGIHSYEKGYFDYERDGFGKVAYTLDETVEAVIQCIENECKCEQRYLDRINSFFAYRDKENCERVLEKIKELGAKNDKRK